MNSAGVRVYSEMIEVKRGAGFLFQFDVKVSGKANARAFVEGYRYVEDLTVQELQADAEFAKLHSPCGDARRIKRVFRKHVNTRWKRPTKWKRFRAAVVPRERYQFDVMMVKLFVQNPGAAWFDNVSLRQMNSAELRRFKAKQTTPRDERFAY
jgi:hypothetical protein